MLQSGQKPTTTLFKSMEGDGLRAVAHRYGKERAANESKTKPPDLDKNEPSKPPTGGAFL
jgi:hypothetical protein